MPGTQNAVHTFVACVVGCINHLNRWPKHVTITNSRKFARARCAEIRIQEIKIFDYTIVPRKYNCVV